MAEIEACPFCATLGARVDRSDVFVPGVGHMRAVFCQLCHGEGPPAETDHDAIRLWNRRPLERAAAEGSAQ